MNGVKWKCFSCGKENTENAKFCARCGQPKKWRCAKCETFLPYMTERCMICNTTSDDSFEMWKIRTLKKSRIIENYENIDDIDVIRDKIKDNIDNEFSETECVNKSDTSTKKEEKRKEKSELGESKDISDIEDIKETFSYKLKESNLNKKLVICIVILSVLLLVVVIFTILNIVLAYDAIDEGQIHVSNSLYEQVQELNDYDEESIYYDL